MNYANFFSTSGRNKKSSTLEDGTFGGLFQIRTGVNGFADRCLATRPRDPLFSCRKNTFFFNIYNRFSPIFIFLFSFPIFYSSSPLWIPAFYCIFANLYIRLEINIID